MIKYTPGKTTISIKEWKDKAEEIALKRDKNKKKFKTGKEYTGGLYFLLY